MNTRCVSSKFGMATKWTEQNYEDATSLIHGFIYLKKLS